MHFNVRPTARVKFEGFRADSKPRFGALGQFAWPGHPFRDDSIFYECPRAHFELGIDWLSKNDLQRNSFRGQAGNREKKRTNGTLFSTERCTTNAEECLIAE